MSSLQEVINPSDIRFVVDYRTEASNLNSAPKQLEQEIPKKLRELMKSRELVAANAKLSKRKQKTAKSGNWSYRLYKEYYQCDLMTL